MAPKKSYTRERLDGIAADSAVKMKGFMPNGKLTCEYLHQGAETTVRGADDLSFLSGKSKLLATTTNAKSKLSVVMWLLGGCHFRQPAASQPTILNIGPCQQPKAETRFSCPFVISAGFYVHVSMELNA